MRLSKRKSKHYEELGKYPERKVYKHLNQIGWDNVDIILIENFECKNKEELHRRERHWIDELKSELNTNLPIQSIEERKEYLRYKDKERYNKADGNRKEYCKNFKKQHYEENKELYKTRDKAYYEKNKASIKLQKTTKSVCVCGSTVSNGNMSAHKKTKKHIAYINRQE